MRDLGDLRDYVTRAHGSTANIPQHPVEGNGTHVGIIDSVCEPPDWVAESVDVAYTRSFLDSTADPSRPHGIEVFDIVVSYAPRATFSFYQVVDENGNVEIAAFADAITAAIADGVDVLNISAGDEWPGPYQSNPLVVQTKRAIRENIVVVAAAGNANPGSDPPPVNCPATHEDVIAVGGLVTKCPTDTSPDAHRTPSKGPYYVLNPEVEGSHLQPKRYFCGLNGCVDGASCIRTHTEESWEGNPVPTDGKPDVLAPVHRPLDESTYGESHLRAASSYGAPLVTGAISHVLGEVSPTSNRRVYPAQLRDTVIQTGRPIPSATAPVIDATALLRSLSNTEGAPSDA